MAVRAVIAETPPPARDELATLGDGESPFERRPAESPEMRGMRRILLFVVLPLVVAFFLMLAVLRTLVEAVAWTVVWGMGLLLGGGLAGLLGWVSHGRVPVETAWPLCMAVGLVILSAIHGWQVGWRWWWAKRSLGPLARALGVVPEEADAAERSRVRWPVVLAQALAGAILGTATALAGWATGWGLLTVFAGTVGGAVGLGTEGAILGAAGAAPAAAAAGRPSRTVVREPGRHPGAAAG